MAEPGKAQARAGRPRPELAGNPGLELFFFFEPTGDGFGLPPIVVLTDAHAIHTCGTRARRGDERGETLRLRGALQSCRPRCAPSPQRPARHTHRPRARWPRTSRWCGPGTPRAVLPLHRRRRLDVCARGLFQRLGRRWRCAEPIGVGQLLLCGHGAPVPDESEVDGAGA